MAFWLSKKNHAKEDFGLESRFQTWELYPGGRICVESDVKVKLSGFGCPGAKKKRRLCEKNN